MFLGVERGRRVRLANSLPCVSRFSGHCGILNISQSYNPPRPVTAIALLFHMIQEVEMKQKFKGEEKKILAPLTVRVLRPSTPKIVTSLNTTVQ
jgi:hypothetical protein